MILRERFKCLLKNLKYIKQERGAVFVLTAILLPVLFGCLGIGYDVGNVYMHKARLQNATDAAALAAGEVFKNPPADDPQYTDLLKGKQIQLLNNHQAADRVAGEYIQKNEINLGNPITIVERSALGYKDPSTQSGNTTTAKTTIFYRVIATEEVPLHFLPVILGMQNSPQKVKATSVARIETTTNTTQTGGGGGTPTPVSNPSIFDNLYTYSEYFDSGLTNANNNITMTFEGNMVFTYGNGSSTQEHFYDMDKILAHNPQVADHLFNDSHANPNVIVHGGGVPHWEAVNDPIIDTYYNTTAYVEAFRSKLLQPHVEVKKDSCTEDEKFTLTNLNNPNSGLYKQRVVIDGHSVQQNNGTLYVKDGNNYYAVDITENDYMYYREGNENYKVSYIEIPNFGMVKCVRIGGKDFLINAAGGRSNCYVSNEFDQYSMVIDIPGDGKHPLIFNNGQWKYGESDGQGHFNTWHNVVSQHLSNGSFPASAVSRFDPINDKSYEKQISTNIFHIAYDSKYYNGHNVDLTLNGAITIGDVNEPIYIIIDESINDSINVTIKNNVRPVILVYFGTSNIKLELKGSSSDVTKLTVYAPYGSVGSSPDGAPIHMEGSYYGNIIAKRIAIEASGNSGEWHQQNFLQNDEVVTAATQAMLDAFDAKTVPDDVKQIVKQRYASALGVNVSDVGDKLFYSKLGFNQKQALYAEWRKLILDYPDYKNMLWPWNSHFDLIIGDDGQPTTTVDSKSVIRIINPHLEDNPYFSSDSKI